MKVATALVVGMIIGGLVALAGVTAGTKHGRERYREPLAADSMRVHPRGGFYDALDTGAHGVGGGEQANTGDRA